MAENQDGQEKTENASAKKLFDARNKGQVSKSTDVTTASILLIGGSGVFLGLGPFASSFRAFTRTIFGNLHKVDITDSSFPGIFLDTLAFISIAVLPIMSLIIVIALASQISQIGFHFATEKFTKGLNFKSIFNPLTGLKRIFFSKHTIVELIKNFAKILVLGVIVWSVISVQIDTLVGLVERPFSEIGSVMSSIAFEILIKMGSVYILIAAADFAYQKWKFKDDMKMTKTEVKEEGKQMEGDPRIKSKLRSLMIGRVRKMMLANVQSADVIITNPTHYAVALSYKQGEMSAPKVVAKGVDFLATKIREIAQENNIPIVEEPPLARALYRYVNIDQEIPENLFKSVAQVLAYIYSLKKKMQ
jgi:flagellar biosynthetic protein FlhB